MSLFRTFKTDDEKEKSGVPVTYGPNDDGSVPTFIVRRRGPTNQQYAKQLTRETEPYRRQMELNTLDEMVSRAILMKVFVETVLVGWSNVQDQNNQPIVFSRENALSLFRTLPELYDDLLAQSAKLSLFRSETAEQERKN